MHVVIGQHGAVLPQATPRPSGTATAAAERLVGVAGLTLKVDGVELAPGDKVPSAGLVFEVIEPVQTGTADSDLDPADGEEGDDAGL